MMQSFRSLTILIDLLFLIALAPEINYLYKDGQIWKRIANNTRAYDPDNNYRSYPENWQQAFAELQIRVKGNQPTGVRNLMQHCSGAFGTLTLKMNWSMT